MAAPPPESSRTPPDTPLSEFTRPHSESMEDSDLPANRKRPRLDSGSREGESLPMDGVCSLSAVPAADMDVTADQARPSKVTINMKSPTSDMASESATQASQDTTTFNAPHPEPDNVISVSSSPVNSPEIEVAEPEDMDQDPRISTWQSVEMAYTSAADLLDEFPKLRDNTSALDNLTRITQLVHKCDLRDANLMGRVKVWMDECVRSLDLLTMDAVIGEYPFWEALPTLLESFMRRDQELRMVDDKGMWSCLEEFALDWARLTLHLMELDMQEWRTSIAQPDARDVDCISERYIEPLSWLLHVQNFPHWRVLVSLYDDEPYDLVARVRAQVITADTVKKLDEYTSLVLAVSNKAPSMAVVASPLTVLANVILDKSLKEKQSPASEPDAELLDPSSLQKMHQLICSVDSKWQDWVSKKSSSVRNDLSDQLLRQLMHSHNTLCNREEKFLRQLEESLSLEVPDDMEVKDRIFIAVWRWKLDVLKRHITEGRMELRAFGVETMQSDLVRLWQKYISNDAAGVATPFIQSIVQFIRSTKIVDYLVGVDSHPQLISRSSNIVGFLIVTSSYTNGETDVIWKTVTESQDSRIIAEVLAMLVKTFYMHVSTSPLLLYICSKVLELPLDRFDTRMLDFCDNLLRVLLDKPNNQAGEDVDGLPLRLCVRLIRESTAAEDIPVDQKTQMQNFGSKFLALFIKAGISEVDRMEIYERCIQDISEMNQFSAGSLQALSALVPLHEPREIWKLATEFDLTRLVINDLLHAVNDDKSDFSNSFSYHGLVARFNMLFRLIDMVPETITPELGASLWNDIFLSKKLGRGGFKAVWNMVVHALSRSTKPNPFLERCIFEYLPGILPSDYSLEVLMFAKQSIIYEIRFHPPSPASEDEVVTIPGMDRIWSMILTAPPGSIENEAMKLAIEVYLDHTIIRSSPRSAVEATHIAIANRCIDQLNSAATTLKNSEGSANNGDITMHDRLGPEIGADEIKFRRSLVFLRQFLYGLRTRPHYSPPRASPPRLPERPLKGDLIEINWQSFDGNSNSKINTLRIGDLSTAAELVERFSLATGFSKLTAISGGQRIDLLKDPDAPVKELKLQPGLLIIRKAPDSQEVARENKGSLFTPVDLEILKHFDEIYELLSLKADLAHEIYDFLSVFPPQERVTSLVRSTEISEKELFPLQTPFIAFYSFNALSACLRDEGIEDSPDVSFVSHSINILVAFLMSPDLLRLIPQDRIMVALATSAVGCLLSAFSVFTSKSENTCLIDDPFLFVKQLLKLVDAARKTATHPTNAAGIQKFVCDSFAILIEGSVKDHKYWTAVKGEVQFDQLIEGMLLQEECRPVRIEVAERIQTICGSSKLQKYSTSKANDAADALIESPTRIDMLATIWESISLAIPKTPQYAFQSAEFFQTAMRVFNSIADKSPKDVSFSRYLRQWSEVMFQHQTEEFVGREIADEFIYGFTHLLELCIELADACKIELDTFDLAEQILAKYLFPDLTPDGADPVVPLVPVMHSATRQKLYNIVLLLCKRSSLDTLSALKVMDELVPRDESSGSNSKMIRAPEGYAGLRNLSNTCYLNSLMTQLFMNVEFRDFMLHLHTVDSQSSQKLLDETQRLFAEMQECWSKDVNPEEFVKSIRHYDNHPIDVTVQMDVDEFYNLLFDRWEAQILDSEDKKRFRSFYGGQLVQQIKSQECSHISERLEPFSAIQCDIKGKASLEESLQAYVEGEIMQGDNKYSCTACGRHVDAVKRACLKDVPDNLIFHLKRFDFDITNFQRSKINDEFQFPHRIDMSPYKVEYLSDSGSSTGPDEFELVGVLVHTGTAESGHYYSYTREPPSGSNTTSWVEFNDSDVSRFDPSTIADQCFGGVSDPPHSMGGVHLNKAWNAYMLFYQRVSTIDRLKKSFPPSKTNYPIQVPVPRALANSISLDNELFIRKYCLLDPTHIKFTAKLLEIRRRHANDTQHTRLLDEFVMCVGLETFEQLVVQKNSGAALKGLEWAYSRETALQNIILRIANPEIRGRGMLMIIECVKTALNMVRNDNSEGHELEIGKPHVETAVERIVVKLHDLWAPLQGTPRAWEDYFEFILKLSEAGPEVIQMLLRNEFLLRCLQLLWLERDDKKDLRRLYPVYIRLQEKGRRFNQQSMIKVLYTLLSSVELSVPALPDDAPRTTGPHGKFHLNSSESDLIWTLEADGSLSMLFRLLTSEQFNTMSTACRIIGLFTAAEPEAGFLASIIKTLETGLRFSPADLCIPFLLATIEFCENAPSEAFVAAMIDYVAQGVDSINNCAGSEHLEFFQTLSTQSNKRLGLGPDWFTSVIIDKLPEFAPTLLMDPDRLTRQQMLETINGALFASETDELDDDARARTIRVGRELAQSCVEKVKRIYAVDQAQTPNPRVIKGFKQVIPFCLQKFYDPSSEEEQEFIQEAKGIISTFSFLSLPSSSPSSSSQLSSETDIVDFIEHITAEASDDLVSGMSDFSDDSESF
ncbi:hypothetical protein N7470_001708 [Penicillium chermesinum]|nr:hypothetical protein N7470_001708 [Penicillium chermesinum]